MSRPNRQNRRQRGPRAARGRREPLALLALLSLLAGALLAAAPASAADRIDTVAGSGTGGFAGDGGFAVRALLTSPSALAPFSGGEAYVIADTSNNRIRRVDPAGTITTIAGAGPCCGTTEPYAGNLVSPTDPTVRLNQPRGVAIAADGSILIADTGNHRIRRVGPAPTGAGSGTVITNVAGNGLPGLGSNDNATTVSLRFPGDVAPLPDGGFLIADTGNNRIARVLPGGIRLITVAGGGNSFGDGGPATSAQLNAPARVVPLAGGGYLIADTGNDRIRRVGADGTITTVAGSGTVAGFGGDGGPATQATLSAPEGVAVRDDGSIAIADTGNERIRLVAADGTISTIAGTGTLGFAGDGGDPLLALLSHPRAVVGDGTRLRIADSFNHRVRAITPVTPRTTTTPPVTQTPTRQVPPGVAPPVRGRSGVVAPVSGTVLIRLKGRGGFVPLTSVTNIPLGSELDTRAGRVSLLFTTTRGGRKASAVVGGGRFLMTQRPPLDRGQLPGTVLLSGPLEGCTAPRARQLGTSRPRAQAAKKRKRKRGRRVDVDADGVIRTQGRYGAAIVRGTRWTIVDRCPRDPRPGTFVAVRRGKVAVTAFKLRRTVLVRAGRSFLAPPRAPRRRR